MSTQIQYLRGSAAQLNSFTGVAAEIVVDTTDWTLRVLDGSTTGGYALVGLTQTQTLTNKTLITPTITGAVPSLSVTGNITTSGNYIGNGAALTGVIATVASTVTGNAQANITSVGTLTSLNVTGTTTAGQFSGAGNTLSNIQGANVTGNVSSAVLAYTAYSVAGANVSGTVSTATSATTAGTVTTAAQGNITSVGNLTSLSVVGTATVGQIAGNGNTLSNIQGANVSGTVSSATTAGTVTTAAQGNITSVGTLSSLSVSGAITVAGGIVNGGANATGNIGSSSTYFNTVFAKATSAQYADLAEMYCADIKYAPGTVVEFGGEQEVTQTTTTHSTAVAGIVSTNPSYLMNATLDCSTAVEVALVGRVPCFVVGTIRKGDRLVSSNTPGVATALVAAEYQPGCIVGKALEAYDSAEVGTIEVAVGRV